METHRMILIAYMIGVFGCTLLLCVSMATTAWAVRDVGKADRDDYIQIRFGLFQKCVWTKANNTEECINTWKNAPTWRRACVAMMIIAIIFCLLGLVWSSLYLFGVRPVKGDCHCTLCSHILKPCSKSTLPIPIATVLAFFALIIMMIILGVSTAQYTYFNDYSMYMSVAALTLLFVCSSLGAGIVYMAPTEHSAVAPVSV